MNDVLDRVRIFMIDQTSYEVILTVPWEVLTNMLLTHGCVITNDAFINRESIVRMMRYNPAVHIQEGATVLEFPTPKGTA